MKKFYFMAAALAFAGLGEMRAQDIYTVEMLSSNSLDGDARFVSMGGAMGAIGNNLSAISINPASAGLYRKSDIALTAGLHATPYNGVMEVGPSKTTGMFNQAGFLYSLDLGNASGVKFLNMGFNYRRSNNLKSYIGLNGVGTNGMSQTWQFSDLLYDFNGNALNMERGEDADLTTPAAFMSQYVYVIDPLDGNGNVVSNPTKDSNIVDYSMRDAHQYDYHRAQWGGVQEYNFNLSMNVNERVYLGMNFNFYNVDTHSELWYGEDLCRFDMNDAHVPAHDRYEMHQGESLTGVGYNGQFGLIVRPVEENPFTIGLSLTTPTAFDLDSRKYVGMYNSEFDEKFVYYDDNYNAADLYSSYRIRTPWKLGLSAATNIGEYVVLDAEYELKCNTSAAVRYHDNDNFSYQGENYYTDKYLQREIDNYMRNVHTFRLGVLGRLTDEFSMSAGYNFVSSPFNKCAYLNLYTDRVLGYSNYYYSTNTDYVNYGPTHRFTFGLGYCYRNHFYMNAGYQFETRSADVYPFQAHKNLDLGERFKAYNDLPGERVFLNRHQLQFTIGYSF